MGIRSLPAPPGVSLGHPGVTEVTRGQPGYTARGGGAPDAPAGPHRPEVGTQVIGVSRGTQAERRRGRRRGDPNWPAVLSRSDDADT